MPLNIFNRWSKEERFLRKIRRVIRGMGKVFNPELISGLEKEKDQGKIYFAIKGVTQDYVLQRMPESYEESK